MPRPTDPRGQKRKPEDNGVDAFDTSPLKSDKWVPPAEAMRVTKVVAGSRTSAVIAESIRGGSPIGSSSFRLVGTDEVAGPPVEQDEHRGEEEGIPKPDRNLAHREAIGCTKRGVPENSSHKSSGFPSSNISRADTYVFLNAALSAKIASGILLSCSAMVNNFHVVFGMAAMYWIVVLGKGFSLHVVFGMACRARQGRGTMSCSAWEF